jgi:hypothetical protein
MISCSLHTPCRSLAGDICVVTVSERPVCVCKFVTIVQTNIYILLYYSHCIVTVASGVRRETCVGVAQATAQPRTSDRTPNPKAKHSTKRSD